MDFSGPVDICRPGFLFSRNIYDMKKELKLLMPKEQNPYYRDNPEYFDELLNLVQNNPLRYFNMLRCDGIRYASNGRKKYRYYDPDKDRTKLLKWITDKTPLLKDDFYIISTKCYWILNGLTEFPKCPYCRKDDKFKKVNVKISIGYRHFCSTTCSSSDKET